MKPPCLANAARTTASFLSRTRHCWVLLALLFPPGLAHTQTTAFTYHGKLQAEGVPASGAYNLRFTLFDAVTGGNIVAGPLELNPVDVANGLFTVRLDFGANVFAGPGRWLRIEVRPPGGAVFTTLVPRQEITSSPMPSARKPPERPPTWTSGV